jgi:hypothetical protein
MAAVYNVTPTGSGKSFTLPSIPNPPESLMLMYAVTNVTQTTRGHQFKFADAQTDTAIRLAFSGIFDVQDSVVALAKRGGLLLQGVDYTIDGAQITTVDELQASNLRAFYTT